MNSFINHIIRQTSQNNTASCVDAVLNNLSECYEPIDRIISNTSLTSTMKWISFKDLLIPFNEEDRGQWINLLYQLSHKYYVCVGTEIHVPEDLFNQLIKRQNSFRCAPFKDPNKIFVDGVVVVKNKYINNYKHALLVADIKHQKNQIK